MGSVNLIPSFRWGFVFMDMTWTAIEKFIVNFGLDVEIKVIRDYFRSGREIVCIEVVVYHEKKIEYEQIHCYKKLKNNEVIYSEGNLIKSISDGILGFLGQDDKVDAYFEGKARELARNRMFPDDYL